MFQQNQFTIAAAFVTTGLKRDPGSNCPLFEVN